MQVPKSKCDLFSLWHTGDTEVEPSAMKVVSVLKVRLAITGNPQVELVALLASHSLAQVA